MAQSELENFTNFRSIEMEMEMGRKVCRVLSSYHFNSSLRVPQVFFKKKKSPTGIASVRINVVPAGSGPHEPAHLDIRITGMQVSRRVAGCRCETKFKEKLCEPSILKKKRILEGLFQRDFLKTYPKKLPPRTGDIGIIKYDEM